MELKKYFPSFTRKAITFTIDDGNLKYDKMFIDIVRPAGIKGTFNLYFGGKRALSNEEYRELYSGFEIANHCNRHPFSLNAEKEYNFSKEIFDIETADKEKVYKTDRDGVFKIYHRSYWATMATTDAYLRLAEECREELEEIFGKGSIKGFVWPYGEQKNERLFEQLKKMGYNSIRKAHICDFSLPSDRMRWSFNAQSSNLEEKAEEFDKLADDGELKFFCFGLHSVDYEREEKWDSLKRFCEKYGSRPNDFWYATVSEIFEYEDAMNSLSFESGALKNPSDKELYVSCEGKRYVLPPKSQTKI